MGVAGVAMISAITLYDTSIAPSFFGSTLTDFTCNVARTNRRDERWKPSFRDAARSEMKTVGHIPSA